MDWSKAKAQAQSIISGNGEQFQLLTGSTSYTDAYNTGSTTTYGYGDPTVTWGTGSLVAIVVPVREVDVQIQAGFFADDYRKIYVDPDTTLNLHDILIYPSGSGIKFLILPEYSWDAGGNSIVNIYTIRRILPRSGSVY